MDPLGAPYVIEEWVPSSARWSELVDAVEQASLEGLAFNPFFAPFSRHYLVALQADVVVGFLMFVAWEIGPHDRGVPPIVHNGLPITEAKMIAVGVDPAYRRQGIGRALRARMQERAKELGCYEVRSVSSTDYPDNHRLKLAMGFGLAAVECEIANHAFVMPLL
ncbi:MAG: GNAT family N-acetyltransferase [Fimbriimonas sp.]